MTTPAEWKAEITRIIHWKQFAAQHDKRHALLWNLPKVGAGPDQIDLAEAKVGAPFSDEYKELLALANGWEGFFILTDLFGTEDFLNGRAEEVRNRPELKDFLERSVFTVADVVPIGASDKELDVYLLISPRSAVMPNAVLWWANEEVDRYPTFREFFAAMVNYNARIANKLAQQESTS
jgi:hypothetical protein